MIYQPLWITLCQNLPCRRTVFLNHRLRGVKRIHTVPRSIIPKVTLKARLEFKLAYYDVAVQHFNHYTAGHTSVLGSDRLGLLDKKSLKVKDMVKHV